MRFSVVKKERGKIASSIISSPYLSSDWGVRFLSSSSKYYDPLSYNNGAVWPFLTGFASLALYRYDNPFHAYSLLKENLRIIRDFDYGYATELLSGEYYIPLEQSVNNQIWSYGTTVSSFVEGMIGFSPNVLTKEIVFNPKIPLSISELNVDNLRAGKNGRINFYYSFKGKEILYKFSIENLKGFSFKFKPVFFGNILNVSSSCPERAGMITVTSDNLRCELRYEISDYAFPLSFNDKKYGENSKNPIINKFKLLSDGFYFEVWGKGEEKVKILSDKNFECKGLTVVSKSLLVDFGNDWSLKKVLCKFKR